MKNLFIEVKQLTKGICVLDTKEYTKEVLEELEETFIEETLEAFESSLKNEVFLDFLKGLQTRYVVSSYFRDNLKEIEKIVELTTEEAEAYEAMKKTTFKTINYALGNANNELDFLRKCFLENNTTLITNTLNYFHIEWNEEELKEARKLLLTDLNQNGLKVSNKNTFIKKFLGLCKSILKVKQGYTLDRQISINVKNSIQNMFVVSKGFTFNSMNFTDLEKVYETYYKSYSNLTEEEEKDYIKMKSECTKLKNKGVNTLYNENVNYKDILTNMLNRIEEATEEETTEEEATEEEATEEETTEEEATEEETTEEEATEEEAKEEEEATEEETTEEEAKEEEETTEEEEVQA